MNLDSLSFALSQISYSVANLTKKNFKSSVAEISHLVAHHGLEAERHLLRCLFSHVDFSGDGKSSGKDFHQTQYLIQECASLIIKSNFVSNLCYAIDNPLHHQKNLKPSVQLFPQLSKVLKLTKVQEVVFGLGLVNSHNPDIKSHAAQFIKQKLPDLLRAYIDADITAGQEGGLNDTAAEVLHLLLTHLVHGPKDQFGISAEQKEAFLSILRRDFPRDRVPVILSPLLYPEKQDTPMDKIVSDSGNISKSMMDGSLADLILEVGYGFCASAEECRNNLMQIGVREITPSAVARVLGMMARTHSGLGDQVALQNINNPNGNIWNENKEKAESNQSTTWNVDIFAQVLQEAVPHLNWKEVVFELDHPGFILKDRQGLRLLVQALTRGLQDMFPIEMIYRQWKNSEGQLSWIQQALKNSDVFCFIDYPYHPVSVDMLKAPPEDDNRDIAVWKSVDLVDTLLHLSVGHYTAVQELFKFPVQNCPDVLVLGLTQLSSSINMLRQELLTTLMPIFLGNHPNSAIVLHCAWHCQHNSTTIRNIIMHSMADWYMRGENDQTRLSRILDVAQDLKALSLLLNATPFAFVIDLACLASRREYLKLDKWLTDKIREQGLWTDNEVKITDGRQLVKMGQWTLQRLGGSSSLHPSLGATQDICQISLEQFIQASVNFLKRRCPSIMGGVIKEENLPKCAQLPPETLATMLTCLQGCAGNVSQELSETILTMVSNCNVLLNKSRPAPPGVLKPNRIMDPPFSNTLTSQMDTLSGLGNAMSSLSLSGSTQSPTLPFLSNINNTFSATPGSPAKILPNTSGQSAFSTIIPPITSQMAGQLGMNNSSIITSAISGTLTTKSTYVQQNPDRVQRSDISQIFPEMNQTFSKEVEEEANSYFQKIYSPSSNPVLTIDEVLDMLKRFKDTPSKKDVFACMLRNLFEEYRFFPQYPDEALHITACLFGGIVEQGLITYMALGVALRYVLEALRKQHGSKLYYFGIAALDRFKNRLKEYPQYCQHLASIAHYNEFPPHLIEYIKFGARSQEPPNRPQGSITTQALTSVSSVTTTVKTLTSTTTTTTTTAPKTSAVSSKPSIANATNIDTLLVATEKEEKIVSPPEATQDKVAFIFNNLSLSNLSQKTEELKELVSEEYYPWVAQYLVMKRASIEPNFHSLYSNFIDTLKMNNFTLMVIRETFRNIKVLLRSDKGIANFSDRSLLKNLGHWLGMLTLAKNKPILQIDIDIKSLLLEAFCKGQQELLYVVPFVAKVLESCAKSKVFKHPNPWTMAIMNVLAELHQEPDLKLNLKFEIEVLCKTLNLDINELKPGTFLKDTNKLYHLEMQLSNPNKIKEIVITTVETTTVTGTPTTSTAPATTTTSVAPSGPPQPQFTYNDINTTNLAGIAPHVQINSQIALFQTQPTLKQYVRPAIERAVQELAHPVVDRSVKIALTTCEQIVKKDFALDPEESRMRAAAHHMVRNLTAGMAMITCREPLLISISNNLKAALVTALRGANQQHKELVEHAASIVAQENTELACAFIQKTAVEKALPEMDKRLATEFELRKHARNENRRYCDPVVLTYQAERMPEQIRLKVGGVTPNQTAVYEEFARTVPGFLPSTDRDSTATFIAKPLPTYTTDEITQLYDKVAGELEQYLHTVMAPPTNPQLVALHSLLEKVIVARNSREIVTALALLQRAVEGLLDGLAQLSNDPELTLRYRDAHILVLKAIQDPRAYGPQWSNKQITRYLIECRDEYKYNIDAVDCLIRNHLVNMPQYDMHLAQSMENGLNYMAVAFAMQLVRVYCIEDKQIIPESDLFNTIETLARIAVHGRQAPEGLTQLIDMIRANSDSTFLDRAPGGPTSMMHSGISQAREYDDPPGLHEKAEFLLREWVNMYHSPAAGRDSTKAFSAFVGQMHQQGILKTDDLITRFFRLCTEMCVDLCYRALADQAGSPTLIRAKCFHTLDAFVRLIALLVKHSGDATNTVTKINLLNKVLGIVAGVLLQDHEVRHTDFQQLPYHRIFIMLFLELNAPEHVLESINLQVLTAFCNTLHVVRPAKAPGFSYAWLELVSHRVFIGRMLAITPQQKGWGMYAQLLIDLFKFLAPFLRNAELTKPIALLYKGTLRVLLVLLHDFPEFLCDYHYRFCDVIPPNCIQMRNLILSAFPRNMRLPDPFTPNLKVDMLPEIAHAPRILTNFANGIQPSSFKKDLDSYIKTRAPVTFLSELRSNLQVSNEPGMRYNIPLINALVLYVGTQAIQYIHSKGLTPSMSTITHSSHMDIFQNLAVDLDTEGRYLFLNAIANQLRYPNSHTHYFSCSLLYLFAEANTEAIQEQITRVLLERLIVNRPHPWGLLITFIELIKNPNFKFWNHEFVHCAPEIEKLFDSVARSCMQPKQAPTLREQEVHE